MNKNKHIKICPSCGTSGPFINSVDPNFIQCLSCDFFCNIRNKSEKDRQNTLDLTSANSVPPKKPEGCEGNALEISFLTSLRLLKPGSRVLDIGCGIGDFLSCLLSKGVQCVGLDASKNAVTIGKNFGFNILHGRLTSETIQKNFTENSFDMVCIRESLYYIDDLPSSISSLEKIVKPGGTLHIKSHILGSPYYWRKKNYSSRVGSFAVCLYTKAALLKTLERFKFKIIKVQHIAIPSKSLASVIKIPIPSEKSFTGRLITKSLQLFPPDRILVAAMFPKEK
jgi:SAM-dependent methyltransferase